jgi:hypothetical protein
MFISQPAFTLILVLCFLISREFPGLTIFYPMKHGSSIIVIPQYMLATKQQQMPHEFFKRGYITLDQNTNPHERFLVHNAMQDAH